MVTKSTECAALPAIAPPVSPQKGSAPKSEGNIADTAKKEVASKQQLEMDKSPAKPGAGGDNPEMNKTATSESKPPVESEESSSTKIQPASRPAIMSPLAACTASSKAVATPSSSTPKVPTKSATRQRKPARTVAEKSLADPVIIAGVNSIIALLQSYGPLSYEQLKFNMAAQLVPINQAVQSDNKDRLQQVLGILVELGVIHKVDKKSLGKGGSLKKKSSPKKSLKDTNENDSSTPAAKEKEGDGEGGPTKSENESSCQPDLNPIYCFGNGIPRMDVVLPSQILNEIKEVGEEVLRMQKRIEILRNTLHEIDAKTPKENGADELSATTLEGDKPYANSKTEPYDKAKDVMKQLLELHPEIVQDQVYAAALRIFKLKDGIPGLSEEDEERTLQNIHGSSGGKPGKRSSASSQASSADGSGKKKRKKGRPRKNSPANLAEKVVASGFSALKANATWS